MVKREKPVLAAAVLLGAYLSALALGIWVFHGTRNQGTLAATLWADAAATALIWLWSTAFHNASLYDPYWSVAPILIAGGWMVLRGTPVRLLDGLALAAVGVWGVRLTVNWARGWHGLFEQDWRYTRYRTEHPRLYPLINLLGIHMMPTLLVFGGLTALYHILFFGGELTALAAAGCALSLGAAALQATADRQLRAFRADPAHRGQCMEQGLWRVSRHPNYLGEILFWWGLWLMQMGCAPQAWVTVAGPLAITGLFVFISVPLMEHHNLAARPGYADYMRRVPPLLPWPRQKADAAAPQE